MKKILVILGVFVLALVGCDKSGSSSSLGSDSTATVATTGKYSVYLAISGDTKLRSQTQTAKVTLNVRNNETGQSFTDASNEIYSNVTFTTGKGLVYEKDSSDARVYNVKIDPNPSGFTTGYISVTAKLSDGSTGASSVEVVGGSIAITGDSTVAGNGSATVSLTATYTDASGVAKSNTSLGVSYNSGTTANQTTDSDGKVTFDVGPFTNNGTSNTSESIVISDATSGISSTFVLSITPASAGQLELKPTSATDSASSFKVGSTYNLTLASSVNGTFNVTSNKQGVTMPSTVTVAGGTGSFDVSSATDTGSALITVTSAANSSVKTNLSITFVPAAPTKVRISASPTEINVQSNDIDKSAYSSLLRVKVTDDNFVAVPNVSVRFEVKSGTSGTVEPASGIVTTGGDGYASATFVAGSSPNTDAKVQVSLPDYSSGITYTGTDGNSTQDLTINVKELSLVIGKALGTSIKPVDENGTAATDGAFLRKEVYLTVTDGVGNAISGATVRMKPRYTRYGVGCYLWGGSAWTRQSTSSFSDAEQDANGNGQIDTGEDANGNGVLDPQGRATLVFYEVDSSTAVNGATGLTTSANGKVSFDIEYPRSEANWHEMELDVSAVKGNAQANLAVPFGFPGLADDYKSEAPTLPSRVSLHGVGTYTSCN